MSIDIRRHLVNGCLPMCLYLRGRGCHEFFVTRWRFLFEPCAYYGQSRKFASLERFVPTLAQLSWRKLCYRHCKIVTSSAAKLQHTDGTYKYKTVDTILLSICAEDICMSFSKSRIAYGNFGLYIRVRVSISFCSDDSKNFVMSAALVTAPSQCLSEASFGECRP